MYALGIYMVEIKCRNKRISLINIFVYQEEEHMITFNNQIEEDKKIVVPKDNLIELHKV